MPFMIGPGALRRTVQYLQKGDIFLRNNVKVLMFGYNSDPKKFPHHEGLTKFVFWHLPQLKYKNPKVEMYSLQNITPSPWIKAYLADDTDILFDCDSRSREEIYDRVKLVLGKSQEILAAEQREQKSVAQNPANFGRNFDRECICEIPGQVPCPAFVELPKEMRGKYKFLKKDINSED